MKPDVLLVSTYELGRQPFGLASPAAWLREAGARVRCLDLSVEPFDEDALRAADLIAFFLPMHLATRMAVDALPRVRRLNPSAHLCCYGLYAAENALLLRSLGVHTLLSGEFEEGLVELVRRLARGRGGAPGTAGRGVSLARQRFRVPDRSGLPPLDRYARLVLPGGERRVVGYTEASRGCKHRCRHCPVVPVYDGRFRIVQREVVLADVRQQVAAGARHITFGDPDFFNGIGHAVPLVEALHAEHPELTYDVTVKVEHLLRHAEHLPTLRRTGCLFVTSAVESFDDDVLARFEKRHTAADVEAAVALCRRAGLRLAPTFVAFTPWTTLDGYRRFLAEIARLGLVDAIAPVQYTIRLLIPPGSRLLELPEVRDLAGPLDPASLAHGWRNADPRVDALQRELERWVPDAEAAASSRRDIFHEVWRRAHAADAAGPPPPALAGPAETVPALTEPWYC